MIQFAKCTVYVRSEFGMGVKKIEAKVASVEVRPHAQYERGLYLELLPKGKRKMRCLTQAYGPSLLVLEGWDHPEPEGMFNPEAVAAGLAAVAEGADAFGVQARYSACDPAWQADFDEMIDAYLATKPGVRRADFRKHSPGSRGCATPTCSCQGCHEAALAAVVFA